MTGLDKTALESACRAVSGCTVSDPFGYDAKTRDVLSAAITAYLSALPAVTEEQVEAVPTWARDDERIKSLMATTPYPESRTVYCAFKQFALELRREFAALLSRPVEVKPLEWHASPIRENSWLAPHGFGENYVAYRYEGQWRCIGQDWPSIDAAKAAAQADYEARIRSALVATSHAKAEESGKGRTVVVPRKPSEAMMYAAACAHYGKRRVDAVNGIDGISMTVDGIDYNFRRAFMRFWSAALSAASLPRPVEVGEPVAIKALGSVKDMLSSFGATDIREGSRMVFAVAGDYWEDYLEAPVFVLEAIRSALTHPTPSPAVPDAGVVEGFDMRAHLQRQRDWSGKTFGPGPRTKGVIDHIRKELGEIESDPSDISEWIDVAILALDGAWRAGYTPEQIIVALVAKQVKNEARNWPDWQTSDPDKAIEHVRHLPACSPAVGEE